MAQVVRYSQQPRLGASVPGQGLQNHSSYWECLRTGIPDLGVVPMVLTRGCRLDEP